MSKLVFVSSIWFNFFLDMLNDDDTQFTDNDNERIYPSYKAYKTNSLKLLIYNESDKKKLELLNDLELLE